jgi:hypothetical protein
MNHHHHHHDHQVGVRHIFYLLYAVSKVHSMCFWPLMRCDFGTHALRFTAFFAMLLMLTFGSVCNIPQMLPYLVLWSLALCYQRGRTQRLVNQGVKWHSRYEGTSWLGLRFPFIRTQERARRLMEPTICCVVGVALLPLSLGLGLFIAGGSLSLAIVDNIHREFVRKQLMAMRDAEIEHRYLAARYRGEVDE